MYTYVRLLWPVVFLWPNSFVLPEILTTVRSLLLLHFLLPVTREKKMFLLEKLIIVGQSIANSYNSLKYKILQFSNLIKLRSVHPFGKACEKITFVWIIFLFMIMRFSTVFTVMDCHGIYTELCENCYVMCW